MAKKKPSILEGEVARILGRADKLKIPNVKGGMSLWVPEDTVTTKTKSINKNGTYLPKDDDCYGYSKVTVNVPGSRIVGEGPDGNDYLVEEEYDENGNPTGDVNVDKIPSGIKIVRPPDNRNYSPGDLINFNGMIVMMTTKKGGLFMDSEHPTGALSHSELDFPITVAAPGSESQPGIITPDYQDTGDFKLNGGVSLMAIINELIARQVAAFDTTFHNITSTPEIVGDASLLNNIGHMNYNATIVHTNAISGTYATEMYAIDRSEIGKTFDIGSSVNIVASCTLSWYGRSDPSRPSGGVTYPTITISTSKSAGRVAYIGRQERGEEGTYYTEYIRISGINASLNNGNAEIPVNWNTGKYNLKNAPFTDSFKINVTGSTDSDDSSGWTDMGDGESGSGGGNF